MTPTSGQSSLTRDSTQESDSGEAHRCAFPADGAGSERLVNLDADLLREFLAFPIVPLAVGTVPGSACVRIDLETSRR